MRKVSEKANRLFLSGKVGAAGNNTRVRPGPGNVVEMALHGNAIARVIPFEGVMVTLAGWPTVTTRSRVNALLAELNADWAYAQRDFRTVITGRVDGVTVEVPVDDRDWLWVAEGRELLEQAVQAAA